MSTKKNSTVRSIAESFQSIDQNSKYDLKSIVEAQAIVMEFYTLFKTQNLDAAALDSISAQINPENSDVLEKALTVINHKIGSKKPSKKKKGIPKVAIPEKFEKPPLSRLRNNLKYLLADYKFNSDIQIPEKFEFNGTSIPEVAQEWLGNPFDKQLEVPGLVHDYLYSSLAKDLDYNKETADLAFYMLLKRNRVPESKALIMYMGVVIGGHFFYMKD